MINDEFIKGRIAERSYRDGYGQIAIPSCSFHNLFPEEDIHEQVKDFIKSGESCYTMSKYSGKFGIYYEAVYPYPVRDGNNINKTET